MSCNCADVVDEKLAEHNTRLTRGMVFRDASKNNPYLLIETEQVQTGRGKPKAVGMFPTFCPFCGVRYEPKAEAA